MIDPSNKDLVRMDEHPFITFNRATRVLTCEHCRSTTYLSMKIMNSLAVLALACIALVNPNTATADDRDPLDFERIEKLADDTTTSTTKDGNCTIVEGDNLHVISCSDGSVEWCADDRCGTDWIPTTWGCQYFPEEGPADDVAVCILTQLAIKCCSCLAVCPDDDEGATKPDGLDDLINAIEETRGRGDCHWADTAGTNYDCALECGGKWLATCVYFESFDATICGSSSVGVTLEGEICPHTGTW